MCYVDVGIVIAISICISLSIDIMTPVHVSMRILDGLDCRSLYQLCNRFTLRSPSATTKFLRYSQTSRRLANMESSSTKLGGLRPTHWWVNGAAPPSTPGICCCGKHVNRRRIS